ncbi:MAG: hypothetical protein HQL79_10895 [Magnetococcales bacterium]|nr:hypothetical protein [Magnetococcales bacterium]
MSQTETTPSHHPPGKWITCIIPAEHGLDIDLMTALKNGKGVITTSSSRCRGYSGWTVKDPPANAMPPANPVSVVTVVVAEDRAEEIFLFLTERITHALQEGNAILFQGALSHLSQFELPVGIPEEGHVNTL